MQLLKFIQQPWHWSVSGLLIGLTVPVLLLLGNKAFGISSSLRHICAACFPADITFFKYDWKKESWNLFFVGGIVIGGFLAGHFLQDGADIQVAAATQERLAGYGIHDYSALLPPEIFSWANLFTWWALVPATPVVVPPVIPLWACPTCNGHHWWPPAVLWQAASSVPML
jgi:uncharacterized membrane protein YedE/YeeE